MQSLGLLVNTPATGFWPTLTHSLSRTWAITMSTSMIVTQRKREVLPAISSRVCHIPSRLASVELTLFLPDTITFPSGMEALTNSIHNLGLYVT